MKIIPWLASFCDSLNRVKSRRSRRCSRHRLSAQGLDLLEPRLLLSATTELPLPTESHRPDILIREHTDAGEVALLPEYAASEILVRYRDGGASLSGEGFADAVSQAISQSVPGLTKVTLPEGSSIEAALESYRSDPNVLYAEPNYYFSLSDFQTPNDPFFNDLWGLHNTGQRSHYEEDADIDAPEAWTVTRGSGDVIVAVIDTGIDYTHPDLISNIWVNTGEISGNGVDDDGNGFVDDVHGFDFINGDADPMDDHSHGTHVAGTIAASGDNETGVIGVAPNVSVMALKIFDAEGRTSTDSIVQAIDYAVSNGAQISNNSYGGSGFSRSLLDSISRANDAGHIFVAAAGNNARDTDASPFYPSGYDLPNVISVAATDYSDGLASFSNYGAGTVDLGAPGRFIKSTVPGGGYTWFSGTSMASPHVAGAVALLVSQNPELTHSEAISQVLSTTDPIHALQGRTVTGGRLNAARMLGRTATNPVRIKLNQESYFIGEEIRIELFDADLMGVETVEVTVAARSGDTETVTLHRDDTHLFHGQISTRDAADPAASVLNLVEGDEVSVTFTDQDDSGAVRKNVKTAPVNEFARLRGTFWDDSDGDRERDSDESVLAGRTVYLDTNNNSRFDADEPSQVTGEDGRYAFLRLRPETHAVAQIVPDDWQQTSPSASEVEAAPVFDNVETRAWFSALMGSNEYGDEVTLFAGRNVISKLEIPVSAPETAADVTARLYLNDGSEGRPSTLLWESETLQGHAFTEGTNLLSFDVPDIIVPASTVTWTLQITDIPEGIRFFHSGTDSPEIGASPAHFWANINDDWRAWSSGSSGRAYNLQARVVAGPDPSRQAAHLVTIKSGETVTDIDFGSQAESEPVVDVSVEVTDLEGHRLGEIKVGQQFRINVYASDLRDAALGVTGLFADVNYDTSLIDVNAIEHAFRFYTQGQIDDLSGQVDEVGGLMSEQTPGGDSQLVFSLSATATQLGSLTISTDAGESELSQNTIVGMHEDVRRRTRYSGLSIEIVGDPDLVATRFDVQDDFLTAGRSRIDFTITNQGTGPVDRFQVAIMHSDDGSMGNDDDVLVKTVTIEGRLEVGQSVTRSVDVQLDLATLFDRALRDNSPGMGVNFVSSSQDLLGIVVDPENAVAETNEENNSGKEQGVDRDDVSWFPFDVNGDGRVLPTDLNFVVTHMGEAASEGNGAADLDGNSAVTPRDANYLLSRIGYRRNESVAETESTKTRFAVASGTTFAPAPFDHHGELDTTKADVSSATVLRAEARNLNVEEEAQNDKLNHRTRSNVDDPAAEIIVEFTDDGGIVVDSVETGHPFQIRIYGEDLRGAPGTSGVVSAFVDLLYDQSLIEVTGIEHAFDTFTTGRIEQAAGRVEEVGGFAAAGRGADGRQLVFTLTATAVGSGELSVRTDAGEDIPSEIVLADHDDDQRHRTRFGQASLVIESQDHIPDENLLLEVRDRVLEISGGPADDFVTVTTDGRQIFVTANGIESQFETESVSRIGFQGGAGADRFENRTDLPSIADGGAGNDSLYGGSGHDTINGGAGDDLVIGNHGRDWIDGQAGNDTALGGAHDDTLTGGVGIDYLDGQGASHDVLLIDASDLSEEFLIHQSGRFTAIDQNAGVPFSTRFRRTEHVVLNTRGGDDSVMATRIAEAGSFRFRVNLGEGDDALDLSESDNSKMIAIVNGDEGQDSLTGGPGRDRLYGGSGRGVIAGHGGDDTLVGGSEEDEITGGDGEDRLLGFGGNDTLSGGDGRDWLYGGDGDDELSGGDGRDRLSGNAGNDVLRGSLGRDTLLGGAGNDSLDGGQSHDALSGAEGDDLLIGSSGHDTLHGAGGNDSLYGGTGDDILMGGAGDDVGSGQRGDDTVATGEGEDAIHAEPGEIDEAFQFDAWWLQVV